MRSESLPTTFGTYKILGRISTGGMAEIYKARNQGPGGFSRTFAIKRILPHLSTHQEFVDMLVDEAKIAGLLSHANIVQILDLGMAEGTYYIAMEYVDGPDLGRILKRASERGDRVPVPHAVYILLEVLKGLEYAHNRAVVRDGQPMPLQIVHRDVTPGNVLVSVQGEVKLTDFGIAKASVKALETLSGVIKGRFDYLSPEQASAGVLDARSDLFSAGVLLYEMVTGKNPFSRKREADSIIAIREGKYEAARKVQPDLPSELDVILKRALEVDPSRRYQTATEMKEALSRFFHNAGFVFTRETLATYVLSQFPREGEERKASSPPTAPAPPPAPAPAVSRAPARPDEAPPRRTQRVTEEPTPPPATVAPQAPPALAPELVPADPAISQISEVRRLWIVVTVVLVAMVGLVSAAAGFYLGVQHGRAERVAVPATTPASKGP